METVLASELCFACLDCRRRCISERVPNLDVKCLFIFGYSSILLKDTLPDSQIQSHFH